MLLDFIKIPNFFKDPDSIFELGMKQKYYDWEDHPTDSGSKIFYNGTKTLPLKQLISEPEYNSIGNECLSRIITATIKPNMLVSTNAEYTCFFASILDTDISSPKLCHTDTTLLSGFVYMQKEKPQFPFLHGTSVIVNNKPIQVEYEYNTCVLFRSDCVHIPNHGFGKTLETSRLTFNIFINSLDISIKNKLFKMA
jgi:hypothetical protein